MAAWIGYVAIAHALANLLPESSAAYAHAIAPGDGRIAALYARSLTTADANEAARAKSSRVARRALRKEPTAVAAITTLGVNALIDGDTATSRRLFAYAQMLSRRDLPTQLWAIEDAIVRNDIPRALKHYDIALRTSPRAPEVLFPVLSSAISDPVIRSSLIKTLAGKPAWSADFIYYAVSNEPDPREIYRLFAGMRHANIPVSDLAQTLLINRLASKSLFDDAWNYYASARPGADRSMSRDPQFAATLEIASLFDWSVSNDPGISASIQEGIFDFAASPSNSGVLLAQMQLLPPGEYILEGRSAEIDPLASSRLSWRLRCHDGHELGRFQMPDSTQGNGTFSTRFVVPADCPAQLLSLNVRFSDTTSEVSGQIDRVQLRPVH